MSYQKVETKEIKKALVGYFDHPFSVRKGRGTASHWIDITWEDGPTSEAVRQRCAAFNDNSRDDMMTDLWVGSQYTTEQRSITAEAYVWAVRRIEAELGIEIPVTLVPSWRNDGRKTAYITREDDVQVSEDFPHYASQHVNQLLARTDLRGVSLPALEETNVSP